MKKFVKLNSISPGDEIVADGSFACLRNGQVCEVKQVEGGGLYVECDEGSHFLAGRRYDDGECVGFSSPAVRQNNPDE